MTETVYLSNWASARTPGHHGPGRAWTIMAMPRSFERGVGVVDLLVPNRRDLIDLRAGHMTLAAYRKQFIGGIRAAQAAATHDMLAPGGLVGHVDGTVGPMPVKGGDTLCCACSKEFAARGECHRAFAARLLAEAGWDVVLDGVRFLL